MMKSPQDTHCNPAPAPVHAQVQTLLGSQVEEGWTHWAQHRHRLLLLLFQQLLQQWG
jgi:hypothetical protein